MIACIAGGIDLQNTDKYNDIIHLSHPTSARHPQMPISDRAAIFSPFAALTGHEAAIVEAARLTDRKIELDEDSKVVLDEKQRYLEQIIGQQPEITVTWFKPDAKKDGGSYVTTTGILKRTESIERVMILTDGTKIPLDDIIGIEGECFPSVIDDGS